MEGMSKKVFTSQKISLFLSGEEFCVQTLISVYGAKYVFDDDDLPVEAHACFGTEIQATYKGIPVRCHFVRDTNAAGSIYSLRFVRPGSLLLRQIEKDVAVSGLPSPWMRGLPRLTTTAKHLPVPVMAMMAFGSSSFNLGVRNFTVGGLLLEYSGNDLNQLEIGSRLELELVTNSGEKFSEIVGNVTHISAELNDANTESSRFQFGLKFTSMAAITELRYRGLIREHCLGLKGEFPADVG